MIEFGFTRQFGSCVICTTDIFQKCRFLHCNTLNVILLLDIKELSYNIIISTTYLQSTELNEIFIWLECLKLNIETYENYVGQITQHQTLFS